MIKRKSIKHKKKPCKGQNKAKGFPGCGEEVYAEKYGLCLSCLREWAYSTGEGQEYIRKTLIPKAKKDVRIKKKDQDRKIRESLKTLTQVEQETKRVFQKWIRIRDAEKKCVSCDTYTTNLWDGGHFYKAEIYSGLIFDERNCHKQCRKCNRFLGGNENSYRKGLIERFSEDFVLELDMDAVRKREYKYSRQELKEIKKSYQKKIREYEKQV